MIRLVAASAVAIALATSAMTQPPAGGAKVYKAAVPAVVWIHSTRPNGLATGSGSLVDKERRLVLTNYHVVDDNPKATIFFPAFRDGHPIPERSYYTERAGRLGISSRVIALDKKADLAIVRLDKLPEGIDAIPLAAGSPDPGDNVHSIGNAGKSGALFGYVKGTVRQVYKKKWKAELGKNRVASFEARVIETDSPTNPGDSGGPLLNDKGELVGVTQGGALDANSVSTFVDVSQVKDLLETPAVKAIKARDDGTTKEPARRETALAVADGAKLFSADGLKAANAGLADLHLRGLDLLIETYASAPADWIEKAKSATPEERTKLFREFAEKRLAAEKARGLAVIVCMDPRFIAVEVPPEIRGQFPAEFAKKLGDLLRSNLKDKKYDAGLTEAVKLTASEYKGKP